MTRELLTVSILMVIVMTAGCNNSADDNSSTGRVVNVGDGDTEMIAAIANAKRTFPFFEKNWKAMKNDGYSLKFSLPTSDGDLEHIWFSPTEIQGNKITGECANDPARIPGLKIGDVRTVTRDEVSDWMIVVGKKCYGGYTTRVLSQRVPESAPPLEFVDPPEN